MATLVFRRMFQLSRFKANVARLASGTALAHGISVASLPFLTRLYAPEDFGLLVLFQAVAAVIAIVATGRYEFAIISTADEADAWATAWLVGAISVATMVLTALGCSVTLLFIDSGRLPDSPILVGACLVLMVGLSGIYQALYFWGNRHEAYGRLAVNKVLGAVAVAVTSLGFGIAHFGGIGLVLGTLAGHLTLTGLLGWQVARESDGMSFPGAAHLRRAARDKADFPKFLIPAGILEKVSSYLHVFILSALYGSFVAGSIGLYRKAVSLPSRTVGNAIRHVFRQRAAKLLQTHGECRALFWKATGQLTLVGLPIFIVLVLFGPKLFPLVFGVEWQEAGRFAQLLAPMFLFGFVVSPISGLIFAGNRPKKDLLLQALFLALSLPALLAGSHFGGAALAVFLFGLAYCIKSTVELWICWRIASGNDQ